MHEACSLDSCHIRPLPSNRMGSLATMNPFTALAGCWEQEGTALARVSGGAQMPPHGARADLHIRISGMSVSDDGQHRAGCLNEATRSTKRKEYHNRHQTRDLVPQCEWSYAATGRHSSTWGFGLRSPLSIEMVSMDQLTSRGPKSRSELPIGPPIGPPIADLLLPLTLLVQLHAQHLACAAKDVQQDCIRAHTIDSGHIPYQYERFAEWTNLQPVLLKNWWA